MIDPIAKLRSPRGSLVSVYINRQPPATRAALVDLLKGLRNSHSDFRLLKSLKNDSARIVDLVGDIDRSNAPAAAIFASHEDGIFEFLPLTHPVTDTATLGPRPYLRPLRSQPRPIRAGVVVADSTRARTYLASGGTLSEIGEELIADRGKENYGGFSGYEEHRNRQRAEEASKEMWRQAGRRLLEAHQDQPLEMMALVGREEDFDSIAAELHPYLRELPQSRLRVDISTVAPSDLARFVDEQTDALRTQRAEELIERVLAEAARGGLAVTGLAEVLEAANAHAVDHLVVAGPFAKPGVICDACGWLGRAEGRCPVCDSDTFEVSDVVSAAMDATVEAGGKVDVVNVASPLDAHGVGALLRFRLGG